MSTYQRFFLLDKLCHTESFRSYFLFSTLRSHLQSKIPDFTTNWKSRSSDHWDLRLFSRHFPSPTLKTRNALTLKAGSYGPWRNFLHAILTVHRHNHSRDNKSAHEDRAVTGISSALINHQQFSINELSPPTRRRLDPGSSLRTSILTLDLIPRPS